MLIVKYILETNSESRWQKLLNQWKHEYIIEILEFDKNDNGITMLVKRKEKSRN